MPSSPQQDVMSAASGAQAGAAVGGPVGAAIGGTVGLFSGLFGGGGSQESGYNLSPENEIQLFNYFQQSMDRVQQDYAQVSALHDAYTSKLDAIDKLIGGNDPKAMQQLSASNLAIAQGIGTNVADLVKNGFISKEDQADLERMTGVSQTADAQFENQAKDNRARLEQDLRRSGRSPAEIAQAMMNFDRQTQDLRQQRNIELAGGAIQTRAGLRQQGFNMALGANQNFLNSFVNPLMTTAGARYTAGNNMLGQKQSLRQEGYGAFKDLGSFKLSGQTQDLLEAGAIGPGSVYQQTGIPRGNTGDVRRATNTWNEGAFAPYLNRINNGDGTGTGFGFRTTNPLDVVRGSRA